MESTHAHGKNNATATRPLFFLVIAIDGAAASGKSTTSHTLAQLYNLLHVDTGAHYRTLTHALQQAGIPPDATPGTIEAYLDAHPPHTLVTGHTSRLALANNATESPAPPDPAALRTPQINATVSQYAALPAIRQYLYHYQRHQETTAREHGFNGLVMEGRDIGTIILPHAHLRLYLEADPAARAQRRAAEGGGADSITRRDHLDTTRHTAPLSIPPGATRIDSTHLTPGQVIAQVAGQIARLAPA
ncbi:MAG: (d)CMP kinase [Puniceicoccales bacterium]|jgi:cytidylate kinase|nr:(d)CMP kinase [Puniceicoccales bacterium]